MERVKVDKQTYDTPNKSEEHYLLDVGSEYRDKFVIRLWT